MKPIVWLASYPKSGNTWFRAFWGNYRANGETPVSINELDGGPIASSRPHFDDAVGYESGDLTADEIDQLRPEVYRRWAEEAKETLYCKIHDAYTRLPDGRALVPKEATDRALYFVRNPLDVAVSFAHHLGKPGYDDTIHLMNLRKAGMNHQPRRQEDQIRQWLLTWSGHVKSWTEEADFPVKVLRYEDMLARPHESFGEAVKFLGWEEDAARLDKAIRFSRFEELSEQERTAKFCEKLPSASSFFRKGKTGSWREALTMEQAERVIRDHAEVMRRWGYLDEGGRPFF